MIATLGAVLAVSVVSVVATAMIVTLLGDVIDHLTGGEGLPTFRRAGRDLRATARQLRRDARTEG